MSALSNMQRMETVSVLKTAAQNGLPSDTLQSIADRYIWNAYHIHAPITEVAGMCFEAEMKAGTLQ
ncbi:MAG: hypothetical protein ACREB3_03530 [Burkholderiales bacterium]